MHCHHCQTEFEPKRSTARYCSAAHRLAAHRGSLDRPQKAAQAPTNGAYVAETLRNDPTPSPAQKPGVETLKTPIPRALKTLPAGIVPDAEWPGMYRVVRPDGSLSVIVNLTRAKDAVRQITGEWL